MCMPEDAHKRYTKVGLVGRMEEVWLTIVNMAAPRNSSTSSLCLERCFHIDVFKMGRSGERVAMTTAEDAGWTNDNRA